MRTRFSRLALSLLTASLLHGFAGCSDDPGASDPARFGAATELQRQRAISAGAGVDAQMTLVMASVYSLAPEGASCPKVTRSGGTTTVTGGCTTSDGDMLSGTLTAKNLPSLTGGGNDPARPIELAFDGFRVHDAGQAAAADLALDGTVSAYPDGRLVASLTASLGGIEAVSEGTWHLGGMLSSADADSFIDVTGLGSATIAGQWSMNRSAPAGALELHGADVLKVNFAATVNACAPITVDGKALGQLCDDQGQ